MWRNTSWVVIDGWLGLRNVWNCRNEQRQPITIYGWNGPPAQCLSLNVSSISLEHDTEVTSKGINCSTGSWWKAWDGSDKGRGQGRGNGDSLKMSLQMKMKSFLDNSRRIYEDNINCKKLACWSLWVMIVREEVSDHWFLSNHQSSRYLELSDPVTID